MLPIVDAFTLGTSGWSARRAVRCCMPAPSPFAPFLDPLERLALPYCITGSVAASVYGEPRFTADIDVVLLLKAQDVPAFQAAFPEADYYVPPVETLRLELARSSRGMFNLVHHASQFKADIYLAARDICFILAATAVDRAFLETEVTRLGLLSQWLESTRGN